jgi:hypothetical protein
MNLEQELKGALDAAKADLHEAEKALDKTAQRGEEIMSRARAERDGIVGRAMNVEREKRSEVRRLEKMIKVYRGEPLTASHRKNNGGRPPQEKIDRVLQVAREYAKATGDTKYNGGFTVTHLDREIEGISPHAIRDCLDALRKDGKIRRAERTTGGGQLYRLIEEGE